MQVRGVPASATPGELRALFEQCGAVRQLVCQFEAGAAEGSALVVFADRAAAQEAADLLDSYPLGTSLLEVQVGAGCSSGRAPTRSPAYPLQVDAVMRVVACEMRGMTTWLEQAQVSERPAGPHGPTSLPAIRVHV